MFASEKVMLDYLSQLLSEENEPQGELEGEVNPTPESQTAVSEPTAEPIFTKKTEHIQTSAVKEETIEENKPELKLQPIRSKVNELREYKEDVVALPESSSVEKLLQQVELKEQEKEIVETKVSTEVEIESKLEVETQVEPENISKVVDVEEQIPDEPFQALFFDVAGLVLAVPLQELGGIHNLTEVNSLFGKPQWFKGVMINREKKLNVVDSAR